MQTSSVKSTSFADDTTQKDQQDLSADFKNATNKVTDSVSDQDADDYVDSSKYAEDYSKWEQLTEGLSDSGDQGKALGRSYAAVHLLSDNWKKWGLDKDKINFNDPSTWSKLPPDAQKALKVISRSSSLISALENTGAKDKKSSGIVTLSQVKDFIKKSNGDQKAALSSITSYEKKNPDAGGMSLTLVRQAALVMANQTLIAGAGSQMQAGATDQRQDNFGLHKDNLSAVASDNGLGSALQDAANIVEQNAIFSNLDIAGNGPGGTGADGAVGRSNIADWIKSDAPTSNASFLSYMSENAIKQSLPDIDSKSIGSDVFENPQNYSGATKAAVLEQLENDESVMESGKAQGLWSGSMAKSKHLSSSYDNELSDLKSKISQLASDTDVQNFQKTAQSSGLQSLADSDPTLKAQIGQYYTNTELTGDSLSSALSAENSQGDQVSVGSGIQTFVSQAHTVDGLLGKSGSDATDLTNILDKSGDKDEVEQAYNNDIVDGSSLTQALQTVSGDGESAQVISNYQDENTALSSVLGDDYTQGHSGQIQTNIDDAVQNEQNDTADLASLLTTFCDANGNASDSKINAYVATVQSQNPQAFDAATAGSVVKEIKKIVDLVRSGYKINDAIQKIEKASSGEKSSPSLPGQESGYDSGGLHLTSAGLSAGSLAASIVQYAKGAHTATGQAGIAASSAQTLGTTTEGTTKLIKKIQKARDEEALKKIKSSLNWTEVGGKEVGAAGGVASGVLSLISGVKSLKNGDKVDGGLTLTSGSLDTISGIAGGVEGAVSAADAAGASVGVAAGVTGAVAGIASGVTAAVGFVVGLVELIIQAVEKKKKQHNYYNQLSNLADYGITGSSDSTKNKTTGS
ncbi:type III effector HrpK domain-containing protein [Acetobacter pasteurianus]|uniref:type III effector HrpK domain-containing protein n=1 Tax=Acetobacter pasteurianus TaxID=438 RepID=UPI003D100414